MSRSIAATPVACQAAAGGGGRKLIEQLHSPKFDPYVRRERRDALLERVASLVEIIEVLQPIRASRDAKNDKFLEAAVNGRADVIVTGDNDLLDLNPSAALRS